MLPATREAAIKHAIDSYPKESCGLVLIENGQEVYVPCENRARDRAAHFVISAEDFAQIEDRGEISAVVHSHPDAHQRASEADQVSCENTGLPWHIFAIHKDDDGEVKLFGESVTTPRGYEAPLVGRQFAYGILDCYTLVQDYYKRELGITLEDVEHLDHHWERGISLYMENYEKMGFTPVPDHTQLEVGDIILMQVRASTPNHAGVYIGNGVFLHHLYGRPSSKDVYGGYWQQATRLIIRRKKDD
jgi:proteasome lid subunit RPN8/RPN11